MKKDKINVPAIIVGLLLLATIILLVVLDSIKAANTYRFYDPYEKEHLIEKIVLDVQRPSKGSFEESTWERLESPILEEYFEEVKLKLKEKLGEYDNLNWERLERTTLTPIEKFEGKNKDFSGAYFQSVLETVFIPKSFESKPEIYLKKLLCHELIHCLTIQDGKATTMLMEGFTEYLAQEIYPYPEHMNYYMPIQFVKVYVSTYGLQKAINICATDEFADEIGQTIDRPNAIYTLEPLFVATENEGGFNVQSMDPIIDVLVHYAAKIKASPDVLSELMDGYAYWFGKPKAEYFQKVLERR